MNSLKSHVADDIGAQQDIAVVKSLNDFLIHYHDLIVMGTSYQGLINLISFIN